MQVEKMVLSDTSSTFPTLETETADMPANDNRMQKCHAGRRGKKGAIRSFGTVVAILSILLPTVSQAEMNVMTDSELDEVTGHGFSQFTLVDGVARAEFDVLAWTLTDINSMKLAYYDDGGGAGWDNNWTSVELGSESEDLVLNGFFIEAEFKDITDPALRKLERFKMGFREVNGTIAADFQSFSGEITVSGNPTYYSRSFLGSRTYQFIDSELSVYIDRNAGVEFIFGNTVIVN